MKCIEPDAVVSWMKTFLPRQTQVDSLTRLPQLAQLGYVKTRINFPIEADRRLRLAKFLGSRMERESQTLVFIQNACIFPSSGHISLLHRLREAHGENRILDEAPGHILVRDERDDLISLVFLSLSFYFDTFVLGQSSKLAIYVSHDEYCEIWCCNETERADLEISMREFNAP